MTSVIISAPADGATITLAQTGPTDISCRIEIGPTPTNQSASDYTEQLSNCTTSADCTQLYATTRVFFFEVSVSIELALLTVGATATINAPNGQTAHQISTDAYNEACAFIRSCNLPIVSMP
jgi:hypothetical protein